MGGKRKLQYVFKSRHLKGEDIPSVESQIILTGKDSGLTVSDKRLLTAIKNILVSGAAHHNDGQKGVLGLTAVSDSP